MPQVWLSILALACRVAPRRDREAFRARWETSLLSLLTLIERGELAFHGRAHLTHLCLSALAAAFWLRFSREGLRLWVRDPSFPLAVVAGALAIAALFTHGFAKTRWVIDLARHWHPSPPQGLRYDPRGDLLFAYIFPIVMAATTAALLIIVGARTLRRAGWRYWLFFSAKIVAVIVLGSLIWIDGGATLRSLLGRGSFRFIGGGLLFALAFVLATGWGALWILADQRRRCPVCLRRLEMPVTLGSWSSVFDPPTTEFLCSQGHGSLALLEAEPAADRWIALDPSWRSLFHRKNRKESSVSR